MRILTLFLISILSNVSKSSQVIVTNYLTTINVVLLYEREDKTVKIFDTAIKYFATNTSYGVQIGNVHKIFVGNDEPIKAVSHVCQQMDAVRSGPNAADIAVDLTRSGISSEVVKIVTKIINMPTISASFGQEGDIREWQNISEMDASKYLIQVSPPADILVHSMRSIVAKQGMLTSALLFDAEQFEMEHKYKSILQNEPTRHALYKLEHKESKIKEQIVHLTDMNINNIFIAASSENISIVLSQASNINSVHNNEIAWYSMSLTEGEPQCTQCHNTTTIMHLSPKMPDENKNIMRTSFLKSQGIDLKNLTEVFYFDLTINAIMAVKEMKTKRTWTQLEPQKRCEITTTFNDSLKLDLFSAFASIGEDNILGKFHLIRNGLNYPRFEMNAQRLIFQESQSFAANTMLSGTWKSGLSEIITTDNDSIKENSWEDHKRLNVLRVITSVSPPFIYQKEGCNVTKGFKNENKNCFEGYCIDLLNEIQKALQFDYTIQAVEEYGYMNNKSPHDWIPDSLIGMLKDRKADMAVTELSVMFEREAVVDFTIPFYDSVGYSIIMKKIRPADPPLFKFLDVFNVEVWGIICGTFLSSHVLIWIYDLWSPRSYRNWKTYDDDDDDWEAKRLFNYRESLWFAITSFFAQGGGTVPRNNSGKILVSAFWFVVYGSVCSFTASLSAFQTVSRLKTEIKSLEDFTTQHEVAFSTQNNSGASRYFERMEQIEHVFYKKFKDMSLNDSISAFNRTKLAIWDYPLSDKYGRIYKSMHTEKMPTSFQEGMDKVKNSTKDNAFAFIADSSTLHYEVLTNCDLEIIGEDFSKTPFAIAVQKGSPLRDDINEVILNLRNNGKLDQLKEKWWNENRETKMDCQREDANEDGINLRNLGGVFIIFYTGLGAGILVLCCEIIFFRRGISNVQEMQLIHFANDEPFPFGNE